MPYSDDTTARRGRPWAVFLSIALGGVALLFGCLLAETAYEHPAAHIAAQTGEHLASALIVAGIMGLTYEWSIHVRSTKLFKALIDAQNDTFNELIEAQNDFIRRSLINLAAEIEKIRETGQAVRSDEVFKQLIHDMADYREKIPTLFSPPRDKRDEFVFSTNHEFFERLVANKSDRERVVSVLRDWLAPGRAPKFRFLASDFVGLLRLHELGPELRKRFDQKKANWSTIKDPQERSCLLNYAWAASRCDSPPYGHLRYLLRTMPVDVQEWILFVPQQMFDGELRVMIQEYLETKGKGLSRELLVCVIAAIRALHFDGKINMTSVARRYRALFEPHNLLQDLDEAIGITQDT